MAPSMQLMRSDSLPTLLYECVVLVPFGAHPLLTCEVQLHD